MPDRFTVEIPLPPAILSPNVKSAHWSGKVKYVRAYRKACWFEFWSARPAGWVVGPVELEVEYRCPRGSIGCVVFDVQNAIGALKNGLDGMVDANIVATDSHKNVQWGRVRLITRADQMKDKQPGVTVAVRRV